MVSSNVRLKHERCERLNCVQDQFHCSGSAEINVNPIILGPLTFRKIADVGLRFFHPFSMVGFAGASIRLLLMLSIGISFDVTRQH